MQSLEPRRLFAVDLLCFNLSVASYDASTGTLKLNVQVTNTGMSAIPAGTINKVFLSTDLEVNNADDITIGEIDSLQIPSGGTLASLQLTLDAGSADPGSYYVGVALDSGGTVTESDDANNYRFSTSKITVNDVVNVVIEGTSGKDTIIAMENSGELSFLLNTVEVKTIAADRVASIVLRGLADNDILNASNLSLAVTLEGGDGKDTLIGGVGADSLAGNASADSLRGGGGTDILRGHGGNDQLYGESAADRLYGDAGFDLLDGGSSNDRLDGGSDNDTIYGQGGDDRFYAKDGTIDQLFGGSGVDSAQLDSNDIIQSIVI
jgi:Ca2+-binding RTX toxin-like protein